MLLRIEGRKPGTAARQRPIPIVLERLRIEPLALQQGEDGRR